MFIAPSIFFVQFSFTHIPYGVIGTVLCKAITTGTVAWIGGAASIVTLAVISIERYYAVVYPLGNKEKLTKRKLKVSLTDDKFLPSDYQAYSYPACGTRRET